MRSNYHISCLALKIIHFEDFSKTFDVALFCKYKIRTVGKLLSILRSPTWVKFFDKRHFKQVIHEVFCF